MKKKWHILLLRWKAESPELFKRLINICLFISGLSLSVHTAIITAGALEPVWFADIYPYLIGIPAGIAFTSKLTAKDGNYEQLNNDGNDKKRDT